MAAPATAAPGEPSHQITPTASAHPVPAPTRSAKYTPFGEFVARKAQAIARPAAKNGTLVRRNSRIMKTTCIGLVPIEKGSRGMSTMATRHTRTPAAASSIACDISTAGGRAARAREAARNDPEAPYPSSATLSATYVKWYHSENEKIRVQAISRS